MKKFFITIFILLTFCSKGEALEIVYPKINPIRINAPSTFFIGSTKPSEKLKINETEVKVAPNGAFAQIVPLNLGNNNFKIISGSDTIDFVIERPQIQKTNKCLPSLIEYPAMSFFVKNNDAPLRMTPVNSGINRLAHLPTCTQLIVNGEKGNFYRVYLNSKLTGWISKSDVEQSSSSTNTTRLKELKTKEERDYCLYEFELDSKPPFIIKEENGITLQLFNIQGETDNTLTLNVPIDKLFGYEVFYQKDKFILKVGKKPIINQEKPLKDIIIAVDAGHGGCENGAIGCCGDKEKDINLAIAKNLKQELESRGAKIIMTREDDVQVSLQERVNKAKDNSATLLISIHANALPDGQDPIKNRGTSVYYYHNQAKPLAESILSTMTTELNTQNDRVRQGSLALVRPTSSVSVLIEVAYIINPDDYALLLDKNFQLNCAKAITDGIEKYLLQNEK